MALKVNIRLRLLVFAVVIPNPTNFCLLTVGRISSVHFLSLEKALQFDNTINLINAQSRVIPLIEGLLQG